MDFIEKFENYRKNQKITDKDINAFFGKGMFNDLPKCFYNKDMKDYFYKILDWIGQNKDDKNNKWISSFRDLFSINKKSRQRAEEWFKSQHKQNGYNKASIPVFFTINKVQNDTKRFIKIPNFQYYFLHVFFFYL